jgi:hypothetical protein
LNVYFEIAECLVPKCGGNRYLVAHNVSIDPRSQMLRFKYGSVRLVFSAERIWIEDGGKITFLKNRYQPSDGPVDRTEFMWIKLKSHEIRGY